MRMPLSDRRMQKMRVLEIRFRCDSVEPTLVAATAEYQRLWESHGPRIVKQLAAATGLRFAESSIEALVFEGISGSHPLRFRASYDEQTKLGTLVHELAHRLIADDRARLSSLPRSSREEHELIDLFLFDAWTDLYGEAFASRQVEVESRRRDMYRDAWNATLAMDRETRAAKLRALLGQGASGAAGRRPPGPRVQGVIFDLWDTLVPFPLDRWDAMTLALADALSQSHDQLNAIWQEEAHLRMIHGMEACLRRVASRLGATITDAFVADELLRRLRFHEECLARPRPDAIATLQLLRAAGLRVGMVSNASSEAPLAWPTSPLAGLIDAYAFSTDEGTTKPDPHMYLRVLDKLALAPDLAVYVGDGAGDELVGARALGMRAVQLKYPGAPTREWEGEAITSLGELLARLGVGLR